MVFSPMVFPEEPFLTHAEGRGTRTRAQAVLLGSAAQEDRQAEGAGRFGVRLRVAAFVHWRDATRQSNAGMSAHSKKSRA